jgi:hypothetical protein
MIKLFHKILTATSNSVRTQNIELGRWSLVYEPKIIHNKVDQANEDHCGCCQNVIQETCKTQDDEYILPYIMESMPHK